MINLFCCLSKTAPSEPIPVFEGPLQPLSSTEKIFELFLRSLPALTKSVEEMDRKLLTLPQGQDASKLPEIKEFHKKLRADLFELVLKGKADAFEPEYQCYLQRTFPSAPVVFSRLTDRRWTMASIRAANTFFEAASQFRRHYISRCPNKLQALQPKIDPQTQDILSLNWISGISSGVLHNLRKTDYTLMCTGELKRRKIIPMSGELCDGSVLTGLNATYLSGTQIEGFPTAFKYAKNFSVKTQEEIDHVQILHWKSYQEISFISDPGALVRASFAIKRLRALGEKIDLETLKKRLIVLKKELKNLETSRDYWTQKLLKDKDRQENLRATKEALQLLEEALTLDIPLLSDEEKSEIFNPFPMIVGSYTLSTIPRQKSVYDEYLVGTEAKLGRDIQVLFVPEEQTDPMRAWLTKEGIAEVAVKSIAILEKAFEMNKLISPRLAEIVSLKKLAKHLHPAASKTQFDSTELKTLT